MRKGEFMTLEEARESGKSRLQEYAADVLERTRYGGYVCPACGSGTGDHGTGALFIDEKSGGIKWKCFSCNTGGDIYDLVELTEHIEGPARFPERVKYIAGRYGIPIEETEDRKQKKKNQNGNFFGWDDLVTSNGEYKPNKPRILSFEEDLVVNTRKPAQAAQSAQKAPEAAINPEAEQPDYSGLIAEAAKHIHETDYMQKRGISLETCRKYGIGYLANWKADNAKPHITPTPRIIIPAGSGYLARLAREPRNDWEKTGAKMNSKGKGLFNLEALKQGGPAFVVEGEIDALSVIEAGAPCVGLGSVANVNKFLQAAADARPEAVIIALDNDDQGRKAAASLFNGLQNAGIMACRANIAGSHKDPNAALIADRSAFAEAVRKALEDPDGQKEAYKAAVSAAGHLQEFINGIAASVNTPAVPTGFPGLDGLLDGGLYEGFYALGAISSLGKTTFVMQMADQIAQGGHDVLIVSLEMARTELMSKSISRHTAQIVLETGGDTRNAKTNRAITNGSMWARFNPTEKRLVMQAVEEYGKYAEHLFILEGVGDIGAAQIRQAVAQHKAITGRAPVVIVDYMQIIAPADSRSTDKQNTDKAVIELKRISRDFKTPVIGISSFNRENYSNPVSMVSFKESGAIEYSTDVLIGLQLEGQGTKGFDVDAAKAENPRKIEMKILKNRNGQTGTRTCFDYYPRFNLFREAD